MSNTRKAVYGFLGVWLVINGVAYVILSLTGLLFPQYQENVFMTRASVSGEPNKDRIVARSMVMFLFTILCAVPVASTGCTKKKDTDKGGPIKVGYDNAVVVGVRDKEPLRRRVGEDFAGEGQGAAGVLVFFQRQMQWCPPILILG